MHACILFIYLLIYCYFSISSNLHYLMQIMFYRPCKIKKISICKPVHCCFSLSWSDLIEQTCNQKGILPLILLLYVYIFFVFTFLYIQILFHMARYIFIFRFVSLYSNIIFLYCLLSFGGGASSHTHYHHHQYHHHFKIHFPVLAWVRWDFWHIPTDRCSFCCQLSLLFKEVNIPPPPPSP